MRRARMGGPARRVLVAGVVVVALTVGAATAVAVTVNQLQDSQAQRDRLASATTVEAQLPTVGRQAHAGAF